MTANYDNLTGTLTVVFTVEEQRQIRRYRARLREHLRRDTLTRENALRYWLNEAWDKLVRWTEKQTDEARQVALERVMPDQLDVAIGFDPEA